MRLLPQSLVGRTVLVFLIGIGALLFLWQGYGYGGWGPGRMMGPGMMGGRGPGMMGYGWGGGALGWLCLGQQPSTPQPFESVALRLLTRPAHLPVV